MGRRIPRQSALTPPASSRSSSTCSSPHQVDQHDAPAIGLHQRAADHLVLAVVRPLHPGTIGGATALVVKCVSAASLADKPQIAPRRMDQPLESTARSGPLPPFNRPRSARHSDDTPSAPQRRCVSGPTTMKKKVTPLHAAAIVQRLCTVAPAVPGLAQATPVAGSTTFWPSPLSRRGLHDLPAQLVLRAGRCFPELQARIPACHGSPWMVHLSPAGSARRRITLNLASPRRSRRSPVPGPRVLPCNARWPALPRSLPPAEETCHAAPVTSYTRPAPPGGTRFDPAGAPRFPARQRFRAGPAGQGHGISRFRNVSGTRLCVVCTTSIGPRLCATDDTAPWAWAAPFANSALGCGIGLVDDRRPAVLAVNPRSWRRIDEPPPCPQSAQLVRPDHTTGRDILGGRPPLVRLIPQAPTDLGYRFLSGDARRAERPQEAA
jgi:hypothetical protein